MGCDLDDRARFLIQTLNCVIVEVPETSMEVHKA
ncbi:hypothetical protein PC129_g22542 [Phytophthora cactorum]|uniref:Uncharacterized protein n=1 Tax=Phytophthora cactorum TaxID=29920 RepID=A0A8T1H2N8_9STRA|nr:hypothetical protein Pcac1_g8003 [Phytophthora cactorum]KAG2797895.1 hypothetical protein PC112_g21581 [Phytophthora cactorum]KAG2876991.1 hypothetical protein PC114_g23897 [Phytophthora cactorum]KAG2893385.1 hypothetical protein PC117_g23777 [Phytophthora cactorum]KAG2971331.1 hypothetical protein PC119_g23418 [Phytophthora cactorum]